MFLYIKGAEKIHIQREDEAEGSVGGPEMLELRPYFALAIFNALSHLITTIKSLYMERISYRLFSNSQDFLKVSFSCIGLQISAPCVEQLIKVDMRMKVFDVAPQEASLATAITLSLHT